VAVPLLLAPLVVGRNLTSMLVFIVITALFALGYNLMFGYTGMLSFGHAAFYGISAYVVAILLSGPGELPVVFQSFLPALVVAVLVSSLVAVVFGIICIQRGGFAFAMLTLALNMFVFEIAFRWRSVTQGDDGIVVSNPTIDLGILTVQAWNPASLYYFSLVFLVASMVVMWRIVNSPYGQILIAIRENPERAEFVGIPVKLYKWTVFVVSAVFISIAGALAALQFIVVSPDILFWETNAAPVLAVLIGGPWTFLGPLVGSIVFVTLEEVVSGFTQHWQFVVGLVLIPIILYFPQGILGTVLERRETLERYAERLRSVVER
jgi:branched-chain amino acid transport system permease protein